MLSFSRFEQVFVETFVRRQFIGAGLIRAEAEFKESAVICRHSNLDIDDTLLCVVGHNDARAIQAALQSTVSKRNDL